jgi:predicted nucleic acid-binding protein
VIHLDTSFLIQAVRGEPHEADRLRGWLQRNEDVAISAIAWAEFLCGPLSEEAGRHAAAMLGEAVPLTASHAYLAAELFNASGRRRGTLSDCLIAACALESGATLATSNPKDFERMPGVKLG